MAKMQLRAVARADLNKNDLPGKHGGLGEHASVVPDYKHPFLAARLLTTGSGGTEARDAL